MSLLIKSGLVVTKSGSRISDVYVENEKIAAVGWNLSEIYADKASEIIDASGRYILPGAIDPHTHIDMPCMGTRTTDSFATGSTAACCGGITTFIDFEHLEDNASIQTAIEPRIKLASELSAIDFSFHIGVTYLNNELLREMEKAVREYGTPSFKAYSTYAFRLDDFNLIKLLEKAAETGALIQLHAETHAIIEYLREKADKAGENSDLFSHIVTRPPLCEAEAVSRAVYFTKLTKSNLYIVHLSSEEGLNVIKNAHKDGINVIAETCPQYLLLDESLLKNGWQSAKYILSPALRDKTSRDALWKGIAEGFIKTIGSDHCPFDFHGIKDMNGKNDYRRVPGGAPGIETTLILMHSEGVKKGRISLEKMVEVTSTNVAEIFGLDSKGEIATGKDADIVIFDPNIKFKLCAENLHMNVDYNPYEGLEVCGMPELVISRGKKTAKWNGDKMEFIGRHGHGRFIRRKPFLKK